MPDLDTKLRTVDRIVPPDLWERAERRAASLPVGGTEVSSDPSRMGSRIAAALVAFAMFIGTMMLLTSSFHADTPVGPPDTGSPTATLAFTAGESPRSSLQLGDTTIEGQLVAYRWDGAVADIAAPDLTPAIDIPVGSNLSINGDAEEVLGWVDSCCDLSLPPPHLWQIVPPNGRTLPSEPGPYVLEFHARWSRGSITVLFPIRMVQARSSDGSLSTYTEPMGVPISLDYPSSWYAREVSQPNPQGGGKELGIVISNTAAGISSPADVPLDVVTATILMNTQQVTPALPDSPLPLSMADAKPAPGPGNVRTLSARVGGPVISITVAAGPRASGADLASADAIVASIRRSTQRDGTSPSVASPVGGLAVYGDPLGWTTEVPADWGQVPFRNEDGDTVGMQFFSGQPQDVDANANPFPATGDVSLTVFQDPRCCQPGNDSVFPLRPDDLFVDANGQEAGGWEMRFRGDGVAFILGVSGTPTSTQREILDAMIASIGFRSIEDGEEWMGLVGTPWTASDVHIGAPVIVRADGRYWVLLEADEAPDGRYMIAGPVPLCADGSTGAVTGGGDHWTAELTCPDGRNAMWLGGVTPADSNRSAYAAPLPTQTLVAAWDGRLLAPTHF